MTEIINPTIFLAQDLFGQALQLIKKNVKKTRLDDIEPTNLLSQDKSPTLQKYHDFLILGISAPKIREQILQVYEKGFRQNYIAKRTLPQNLVPSMIKEFEQLPEPWIIGGRFLCFLLTNNNLFIKNIDKSRCLKYLLEASRHKIHGQAFAAIIQDTFDYLSLKSQPEINIFLSYFANHIVNELQCHNSDPELQYSIKAHEHDEMTIVHNTQLIGKYGKCFICGKPAKAYDKEILLPLCGQDCKTSLTEMRLRLSHGENFDLFNWLVDQCVYGDELIWREILKQLRGSKGRITDKHIKILVAQLMKQGKNGSDWQTVSICHNIYVQLFSSFKTILKTELKPYLVETTHQLEECLLDRSTNVSKTLSLLGFFTELYRASQNIHNIYVNYDCKYYENNLLEEQLSMISKLSISDTQTDEVRKASKKCLAQLLMSQLNYIKNQGMILQGAPKGEEDEQIAKEKKVKSYTDKGIILFNQKPSTGLEYLKSNYFEDQQMTNSDIARFIMENCENDFKLSKQKHKLKKEKIGEFFGQDKPISLQVYKAFLELVNFEGLEIDNAMRKWLTYFSLPKETQQIERVLEHFCIRYMPYSGIENSDNLYVLAYAILMLQTTTYNPNIKPSEKIDMARWMSMCKNIVTKQKAEQFYYSVQTTPLSVRPDPVLPSTSSSSESIGSMSNLAVDSGEWTSSSAQVVSLLQYFWQYLYVGLVDQDNHEGLYEAVAVYGSSGLEQSQCFINALVKQAEKGNIKSYDAILKLAACEGRALGKCWGSIVKFIYQMEENDAILGQSSFDMSIIDNILSSTCRLPAQRFLQFLEQFLEFSGSSVEDTNYSRQLFVLKHLSQILEYNLPRIKEIWEAVWFLLNNFYMRNCLHPKYNISMSALDSLKQLTLKLIKIPQEEGVFMQSDFMNSYVYIFQRANQMTKDLIVSIIGMLVSQHLRSGWDTIFTILEKAEGDVVLKVTKRIIEIGLTVLPELEKLHTILVKEVKLSSEDTLEAALNALMAVSKFINKPEHYLTALRTILGRFEELESVALLKHFFILIDLVYCPQAFEEVFRLYHYLTKYKDYHNAAHMFAYMDLLPDEFLLSNLARFLDLCDLNLDSMNRRIFLPCLNITFRRLIKSVTEQKQLQSILNYLLAKHQITLPSQILKLSEVDEDFCKTIDQLPQSFTNGSPEKKQPKGKSSDEAVSKAPLIELQLQKEWYEYASIFHLLILDMLQDIVDTHRDKLKEAQLTRLSEIVAKSYATSKQLNERVVLRMFLWKNNLLKTSNPSVLPGLLKQQIYSLKLLCKLSSNPEDRHSMFINFLKEYTLRSNLLYKQLERKVGKTSLRPIYEQELTSYLTHFKPLVLQFAESFLPVYSQPEANKDKARDLYQALLSAIDANNDAILARGLSALLLALLDRLLSV